MATYGGIIHVYIFSRVRLFGQCLVSLLPRTGQSFSETCKRMAGEVIYIFYSYDFGLYSVLLKSMTAEHNHGCHQEDIFCLFITLKSICLKSLHSGTKSKAVISHNWYDVLGLYLAFYCMWQFSTYFKHGRMW